MCVGCEAVKNQWKSRKHLIEERDQIMERLGLDAPKDKKDHLGKKLKTKKLKKKEKRSKGGVGSAT